MRKLCAVILSAVVWLVAAGTPARASISDLLVVVMKKATAGITIS